MISMEKIRRQFTHRRITFPWPVPRPMPFWARPMRLASKEIRGMKRSRTVRARESLGLTLPNR